MSSSTANTSWNRLVRFHPQNNSNQILWGEPILENANDDIAKLADEGKLRVNVLEGDDFLNAKASGQTELVGQLLGPLSPRDVPIIRCIGLNYKTHILETGRPLPTCPTIFTKPGPSVADYNEDILIPVIAQEQCDYEGELVVVIGKDAKNVKEEDALDYVAAYTVGNDISARDWQRQPEKAGPVPQWTFSKSFDKYAPLGPSLVSSAILGAADNLGLKTLVNGEVRQQTDTSDLYLGVRKLVAFCSQGQTLQRGSLIMTGTPGGVGLFMKPPNFLKDGDRVDVVIDKIGRLTNRTVFEKE